MTSQLIEVKTAELEGVALDWAAAKAIGAYRGEYKFSENGKPDMAWIFPDGVPFKATTGKFQPSTDWSKGGPLIDNFKIGITHDRLHERGLACQAILKEFPFPSYGGTALIAACRAIVASKLGDTVSIPRELLP